MTSPDPIDDWPTEQDTAEMCGCGHMLGQYHYGDDWAPRHDDGTCQYASGSNFGCPNCLLATHLSVKEEHGQPIESER